MGILPADALAEIFNSDNELTAPILIVPEGDGGETFARRAYIYAAHADGYDVDVSRVIVALPTADIPPGTERGSLIIKTTPPSVIYRIVKIKPEESGITSITVAIR